MNVAVNVMDGATFFVDIDEGEHVIDVKGTIIMQQGYPIRPEEIQLVLGSEVLEDTTVLSNTSVKDGDALVLLKTMGVMELLVGSVYDDTQWHGKHKFALRSRPLQDEVEKIEVTVGHFGDQGWGGCQARLFIYLHDPSSNHAEKELASMKIFGPLRTDQYDERKHKRSPSCNIGADEQVVALAKPGMVYKLRYQCGGGGGHSITVNKWSCKIFPRSRSTDKVTVSVSGDVNLRKTSRLGPDRTTGKYELQEPPYP
jgi:hypothetical protein